jgi:hypothetical protein
MIFRESVPKTTAHRHRPPWAESKRLLEAAHRHGPSPNAVDRHAEVVQLWWAQSECRKSREFRAIEQLRTRKEGYKILPACSHPYHLAISPGGAGPVLYPTSWICPYEHGPSFGHSREYRSAHQPVEAPQLMLYRKDLHLRKACLDRVAPQGRGAHHGARARRRLLGHPHRQAVQDAETVH